MWFLWFYDLPTWFSLPVFLALFVGVSWALLLGLRPWVQRVSGPGGEWDRVLGYAINMYGVFYGITLALVAVSVFQNFVNVDQDVTNEAAALGALYRDVSGLPQPISSQLQDLLRTYTHNVVVADWPLQARDQLPTTSTTEVDHIQVLLTTFRPKSEGESNLQAQALSQFSDFVLYRRHRINDANLTLPNLLWALLWVGAVINQTLIGLIDVRNLRVHLIIVGLISIFVGLLIFVTLQLDHPYFGGLSISPEAYQVLLDDLMRPR